MKQDVEMEKDQPYSVSKTLFNNGNLNDDMEIDEEMGEVEAPKPLSQQDFRMKREMTEQERLDYFHNAIAKTMEKEMIEEDFKTKKDPLE